jgi:large subunit ribosomal protein L26e
MSSHLSAELREKHGVRAVPIRKSDEVTIMRGEHKGQAGKVLTVYRKRWAIHVEKLTKEKINGQVVPAPIHPSNVMITKLKIDKDRKSLLERKARGRKAVKGQKYTAKDIAQVD